MGRNKLVMPFVKWVGGKRQLLGELEGLLPAGGIREYCEPFLGGGAVLFHLQPDRAYVNDINSELVNVYRAVRDSVDELIRELAGLWSPELGQGQGDFMRLVFPDILGLNYRSPSQRIRVLSESWMRDEMYCPSCGNDHLTQFPNNSRLADFFCEKCGEVYELKSKGSLIGRSILDGAYYAAIERITSSTNPNLFVLYYKQKSVEDLTLVSKHFFTPDILIKRKALSSNARRAGYVGSVIMYENIPVHGKIAVIKSH